MLAGSQKKKKIPSGVCEKGVDSNSILCLFCKCLVYKMYSFIRVKLKDDSKFICHSMQISRYSRRLNRIIIK